MTMNSMAPVGIALLAASAFLLFYFSPHGGRPVTFLMTIPIVEYLMPVVILVVLALGALFTVIGSGLLGWAVRQPWSSQGVIAAPIIALIVVGAIVLLTAMLGGQWIR
jgi:hypothetical protein